MATKKWLPIVVGGVIFVVLVGAGLLGAFVYVVKRDVKVQTTTAANGQAEFDRMVQRWKGQTPLIVLPAPGSDGQPVVHRELETHGTGSISTVHIRVWAPSEQKLSRVDMPFWLFRLGGNRPFTVGSDVMHGVDLQITPEDIDRRGPGLILLWTNPRGHQLLIWTE